MAIDGPIEIGGLKGSGDKGGPDELVEAPTELEKKVDVDERRQFEESKTMDIQRVWRGARQRGCFAVERQKAWWEKADPRDVLRGSKGDKPGVLARRLKALEQGLKDSVAGQQSFVVGGASVKPQLLAIKWHEKQQNRPTLDSKAPIGKPSFGQGKNPGPTEEIAVIELPPLHEEFVPPQPPGTIDALSMSLLMLVQQPEIGGL